MINFEELVRYDLSQDDASRVSGTPSDLLEFINKDIIYAAHCRFHVLNKDLSERIDRLRKSADEADELDRLQQKILQADVALQVILSLDCDDIEAQALDEYASFVAEIDREHLLGNGGTEALDTLII